MGIKKADGSYDVSKAGETYYSNSILQHKTIQTPDSKLIFREKVPNQASSLYHYFTDIPPMKLDDIMCFEKLIITSTFSDSPLRIKRMERILNQNVSALRSKLPNILVKNKLILISNNLISIISDLQKEFPQCEIQSFPQNAAFNTIFEKIASAKVVIGDHISSLIHFLVMSPKTTVIDMSPESYSCFNWSKNFQAKINSVSYLKLNNNENCQCENITCYPINAPPMVKPSEENMKKLFELIKQALSM